MSTFNQDENLGSAILADGKNKLKETEKNVSNAINSGIHLATEKINTISDTLEEEMKEIKEHSEEYIEQVTDYVKKNPGKSLLAAIAGGFIFGLLYKK